jgi:hypothetical protein
MAELENPRHEQFAKLIALGMDAFQAHGRCGFKADRSNCIKLKKQPDIAARIAELRQEEAQRRALARGDGAEETGERLLRLAAEKALTTGNLSALVQAAKEIGASDGSLDALTAEREGPATPEEIFKIAVQNGPRWVLGVMLMCPKTDITNPWPPDSDIDVCEEGLRHWFSPEQIQALGRRLLSPPTAKVSNR